MWKKRNESLKKKQKSIGMIPFCSVFWTFWNFRNLNQVNWVMVILVFSAASVSAQGQKLQILGSFGDAALENRAEYKIENAYDGSETVCYIPATNKFSSAQFTFQNSRVTSVRILNRQDCCG